MAYGAIFIADKFLEKAGCGLDPMKLIKLTYLSQGWNLGLYGKPLVWDDAEAWRYGPVFREVYGKVAGYPIVTERLGFGRATPYFTPRDNAIVDQVWDRYGSLSGLQLSALTHAPGSPWDVTYRLHGQNAVIPKELMREYFAKQATRAA
jgi:uncharacterized phage-associated protein